MVLPIKTVLTKP